MYFVFKMTTLLKIIYRDGNFGLTDVPLERIYELDKSLFFESTKIESRIRWVTNFCLQKKI